MIVWSRSQHPRSWDNALVNPANWADNDWMHAQFAWLRQNDPVRRLAPDGYEPFWNLTRYHDVQSVEQQKALFINDPRPTLGPEMVRQVVEQLSGRKHLVRSLVQMDRSGSHEVSAAHPGLVYGYQPAAVCRAGSTNWRVRTWIGSANSAANATS